MRLYHGASKNNIVSIMKNGIIPMRKELSYIRDYNGDDVKAVCLTESLKKAKAYANRKVINDDCGIPIVIDVVVDKNNVELGEEERHRDNKVNVVFLSRKKIPVENIRGFRTVELMSYKEIENVTGLIAEEKIL